jgi:hypothetical protein
MSNSNTNPIHPRMPLLAMLLMASAISAEGPLDRSWRSLGMGGAGVAISDDLDAVHQNPAGLSQMGFKGSCAPLDNLGYNRNVVDAWLMGVGVDVNPVLAMKLYRFYDKYDSSFNAAQADPKGLLKDQQLFNDIYQFDRLPIPVKASLDIGGALRNYGAAIWTDNQVSVQLDRGALLPKAGLRLTSTIAAEGATSRSFFGDRLNLGFGYRLVARTDEFREYDVTELQSKAQDEAPRLIFKSLSNLRRSEDWGHGMDFGFIWFQQPGLRYAGSIQNVGMKFYGKFLKPDLALGLAWAPRSFQRNDMWGRKINFALSGSGLLDDTLGYKPLSKLNVGAEWEQTVIPHVLVGRLSVGLKGGYYTAGASGTILQIFKGDFLTYAEEGGKFTGAQENRYYLVRMGIGI